MDLIFYLTTACFIALMGAIRNNIDFDYWARLIVGKSFFQTGTLFSHDFYSYGTTNEFIDHEWGSSLIFYFVQNYLGDIGIFILKSILIFLTIFLIVKIIRMEKKDAKMHFLIFFFALHSISYNVFATIRCQNFSFLFFIFYLYILKKAKLNYRILWVLPILNIIWANMHGGFAIGLVLILLFAFGELLNKNISKPYFITFLASCLTTLINPYGIKYISFIFKALCLNRIHITEWHSAFFHPYFYFSYIKFKIFFIFILILFIYSIIKNIKKSGFRNFCKNIDKGKYLIIIFCALISVKSLRFHIFFTYVVLALCYNDFYEIFNKKLSEKLDNLKEIILFILIFISTISHLLEYKFINQVHYLEYPIFCVEFLKINNLKGNLLTNFHLGSYSAYKLYPNIYVYMDGRYEEVYDVELINIMKNTFLTLDNGVFDKYHTDFVIIGKNYGLYDKLKSSPEWFIVLEDQKYALFLPISYKDKKFIYPTSDLNYYNSEKLKTSIDWN